MREGGTRDELKKAPWAEGSGVVQLESVRAGQTVVPHNSPVTDTETEL